jgi:hypothetical protein
MNDFDLIAVLNDAKAGEADRCSAAEALGSLCTKGAEEALVTLAEDGGNLSMPLALAVIRGIHLIKGDETKKFLAGNPRTKDLAMFVGLAVTGKATLAVGGQRAGTITDTSRKK